MDTIDPGQEGFVARNSCCKVERKDERHTAGLVVVLADVAMVPHRAAARVQVHGSLAYKEGVVEQDCGMVDEAFADDEGVLAGAELTLEDD